MRKLLGIWLLVLAMPAMAVEIDGRIDPQEWAGAQHVDDFRMTQPLTRLPGSQPTEAWILATPEGLAVGFRMTQPASIPRTRQRVQRDFDEQVDRVNLNVDFDGDGRTGYNFTVSSTDGIADAVISNENSFNNDWDGNWKHAVSEDAEGWSAEMLIPWYIAPMRKAQGDKRTIKINLDRVIGSTGERSAWPAASFERPRFLSDFAAVEVAQYSQSLLTVTPYVSGLYDNVHGGSDFDGGADIFWKPNGQFQMTATINPDFGQVESDDLVVNFGATETFISDKRPFFTENQGLFEYTTPSDFSQLLYTRRVGGPADDGNGAGDITAAVKLNGSLGQTKYGVFSADEAGEAGRSFHALRLVRDFDKQNLGMMLTQVERPFFDREATVLGVDHNWRPNQRWNVQTRVFGSQIEEAGETTRDLGGTLWADYEMDHGWRQQWIAMHFGNDLQINDAGYLSRNSTNYLHWEVRKRFAEQPQESRYSSKEWRWRASSNSQRPWRKAQRPVPHEPRGPAAQRELRIRADQYQQRRRRRPADPWPWLGEAAGQLQCGVRVRTAAQGRLGARSGNAVVQRRAGGQFQDRLQPPVLAHLLHQRCLQPDRGHLCRPHAGLAGVGSREEPAGQLRWPRSAPQCGTRLDHQQQAGTAGQAAGDRGWTRRCARPMSSIRLETQWSVPCRSMISA